MQINIKNFNRDKPTDKAIGFNCARSHHREAQLKGLHKTKLGNPHYIGKCQDTCGHHTREEAIIACSEDEQWRKHFVEFEAMLLTKHKGQQIIDLWCWCAPEACHCDVIKAWLLENPALT